MLPHGADFALDLLPPGLFFPDPVRVDRVTETGPRRSPSHPVFSTSMSAISTTCPTPPGRGVLRPAAAPSAERAGPDGRGAGRAGRELFPRHRQAMVYGLSARAVALGTGGPVPEEFPALHPSAPAPGRGRGVRIEAVIDSPSLAGHLDMTLRPGGDTVTECAVTLLPRREIADIGVAPLTSMYLKGPLRASVSDDFRPRVHDSDVC
jgi:glucans biosynthesis protein